MSGRTHTRRPGQVPRRATQLTCRRNDRVPPKTLRRFQVPAARPGRGPSHSPSQPFDTSHLGLSSAHALRDRYLGVGRTPASTEPNEQVLPGGPGLGCTSHPCSASAIQADVPIGVVPGLDGDGAARAGRAHRRLPQHATAAIPVGGVDSRQQNANPDVTLS